MADKEDWPDECEMFPKTCHSPPKHKFRGLYVCTGCRNDYLKMKAS